MINNKKVVVVLPAYNAAKTLEIGADIVIMSHPDYHTLQN